MYRRDSMDRKKTRIMQEDILKKTNKFRMSCAVKEEREVTMETDYLTYNQHMFKSVIKQEPKLSADSELLKRQVGAWRVVLQRLPITADIKHASSNADEMDLDDVISQSAEELIYPRKNDSTDEEMKYVNTQDFLDIGETVITKPDIAAPAISSTVEDLHEADLDTGSEVDPTEEKQLHHYGFTATNEPLDAITVSMLAENLPPEMKDILVGLDMMNDASVSRLLPGEHSTLSWEQNLLAFRGVRDSFTGTPGPTFPFLETEAPVDAFLRFWDEDMIDTIVLETNRYAEQCLNSGISRFSRAARWKPTDKAEMYTFLAMIIHQSMMPLIVEKDFFVPSSECSAMPNFKKIIPYDRWILLKKFLHFNDNSLISSSLSLKERMMYKIQPVLDHLNSKFQSLYLPGQTLVLDESFLKWHLRLPFIQKIATAKAGLKTCGICEASSGYLWKVSIYAGDGITRTDEPLPDAQKREYSLAPQGVTAQIVCDLASPLFHKGHTIVMDSFYNSPLLARCLKLNGMDCYGTLRLDRDSVPEILKSIAKSDLNAGEIVTATSGDINVMVWKGSGLVTMLSTYHDMTVGKTEKYGKSSYKPTLVHDYDKTMRSVDMSDQVLDRFPVERMRNMTWYKKLFRKLLNVSVINAYIIYKCKNPGINHREFKRKVADGLLDRFFIPRINTQISNQVNVIRMLPGLRGRGDRPVLENNHYCIKIDETSSKLQVCVWCKLLKKQNKTTRKCDVCNVPLCVQCMKPYHTGVNPESS